MLNEKISNSGGQLPPQGTDAGTVAGPVVGPVVGPVAAHAAGFHTSQPAANEATFRNTSAHQRRMRRHRRGERARSHSIRGWSVGMW